MRQEHMPRGNGYAISRDLNPTLVDVRSLTQLGRDARKHPPAQVRKLGKNLERFGFVAPIIIDQTGRVVAGWALVLASRQMGLTQVPAVAITDLGEAELRVLRLALNRLTEDSNWDGEQIALEFADLMQCDPKVDLTLTGFEMGEVDMLLAGPNDDDEPPLSAVDPEAPVVSRPGDLWECGPHRLLCGDATKPEAFKRLMGDEHAQMVFTDPPYNVPIAGHVSGLGAVHHDEFAMAAGEMTEAAFIAFLTGVLGLMAAHRLDGAISFICIDWRHVFELLTAGRGVYDLKNICVWAKTNAGMGSLYRSQHEFVAVFKKGTAAHINNVELGRHGRNRTNLWTYPGMNTFGAARNETLALHPTVKPIAMVKDAIFDCSRRGGIVLDAFVGSGTTLIAAERVGRRGFGLEIDPRYVDIALRRFRSLTGIEPVHAESGLTFDELERRRACDGPDPSARQRPGDQFRENRAKRK